MINRIYKLVLFISNNPLRGNVVPQEFNLALYNAIIEIYEEYFFELNRAITRKNRGLINNGFADLPECYREKIKYYLTKRKIEPADPDNPIYILPNNLRYLDAIFYQGNEIEPMVNSRQFLLLRKYTDICIDDEYPVYLLEHNQQLQLLPKTNEPINIWYLRNPLPPNWTYKVFNGVELFNPDADDFQDVDMHVSEESNLVRRVLLKMGINLKEQELTNYMLAEESKQFKHEITS
ncbi:hypothetical protein [Aquimarina longa]|uniref:hypothetical protein n=1 Tax=Aquimarina longa TaxID=1080221 RepID=UPI000782CE80|nr:hypothetical protein [Aquimarina longa]